MNCLILIFLFKQKTAYEMRIRDWSSDVCSSDLENGEVALQRVAAGMELPVAEVLAVAAIVAAVVGELDVLLDLRRFGLHRGDVVLEPCAGGAEKFAR